MTTHLARSRRLGTVVAGHRLLLRGLIAVAFALVLADGFAIERSLPHLLVGHTGLVLVLFVALLLVESARETQAGPESPVTRCAARQVLPARPALRCHRRVQPD
jgi:protein-S-isoprenylcysteine O-methyltransferase Ste14